MVITVLVEGGTTHTNPALSEDGNAIIRRNSAALRQALNEFFSELFDTETIDIRISTSGGKKESLGHFLAGKSDFFYTDLDRVPEKRDDWFLEMSNDGLVVSEERKDSIVFWIQEMESWFLKQPSAMLSWAKSSSINIKSGITEQNFVKDTSPKYVEHLQQKSSFVVKTLFARYFTSQKKGKNGKPKKVQYGKLRHAPQIIHFLNPHAMLLQDEELARFSRMVLERSMSHQSADSVDMIQHSEAQFALVSRSS